MSQTKRLVEHALGVHGDSLPDSAVASAKDLLLDAVGVILAGSRTAAGSTMSTYVSGQNAVGRSRVLASSAAVIPQLAALANGTMAAEVEQDDVHSESNLHASSVFVPAILALAEAHDGSGLDTIEATVAAYDVGCSISIALADSEQYARGFHPTSVSGAFGATAGGAKIVGLNAEQFEAAIALTASQACGLLTWELEPAHYIKSFQSGVPARNAVTAVELAAAGYRGAPDVLDDHEINIFDAFSTRRNFDRLTSGLSDGHEIERTGYKFYSCCRAIHSSLDILLDLASAHGFGAQDVEKIDVQIANTQAPIVNRRTLITHNLQYILAAALTDGEITLEQLSARRFGDQAVQELSRRITLSGDDELQAVYPRHWSAKLQVRLRDGREFADHRLDPRGTATFPANRQDIDDKFERMAAGIISADAIKRFIEQTRELERVSSVRDWLDTLWS